MNTPDGTPLVWCPAGSPKMIPPAIAKRAMAEHEAGRPFKVDVITGASIGASCDGELTLADAIDRRLRRNEDIPNKLREFRSFSMDTFHRYVIRNNEIIDLTPIEYSLLAYLADHPDTLLLYQELYEQVWSCDSLGDNRTIMVHISNLRKKLDPEHKGLIGTVRGVGYVFSDL